MRCNDCEVPRWAPEEFCKKPHGWCRTWLEWVEPGNEACHKVEPTEEALKRLDKEAEDARWSQGDRLRDRLREEGW